MIRRSSIFTIATALAAACSSGAPTEPAVDAPDRSKAAPTRLAALSTDPLRLAFGHTDVLDGWILVCDNSRICRMQPRASSGSLMIRRDPGPNGRVLVVLDGQEPDEPSHPNVATIRLAGVAAGPPAPWRVDREADRATLEGDAAIAFVRTLTQAMTLSYDIRDGTLEIPLRGVREALAAMDEAQGHAGGEAAFIRTGPRPRAALPPAPALPVIAVAPPASTPPLPAGFAAGIRRDNPRLFADCEAEPQQEDEAYPLNAADVLVMAECSRGLTHISSLLLRVPRDAPGQAERVILPIIPEADDAYEDGSGTYVDLEWDPATRQLHSIYRSCAGSCGDNVSWVFDGERFRLLSYSFYQAGGAESLELYRAEVRQRR